MISRAATLFTLISMAAFGPAGAAHATDSALGPAVLALSLIPSFSDVHSPPGMPGSGEPGGGPDASWGYVDPDGPSRWGDLPGFESCGTGLAQSPIDLDTTAARPGPGIEVEYVATSLALEDTGHGLELAYQAGSTLRIGDAEYRLLQLHFHRPSEHTLDGVRFPMEMHLVHSGEGGMLAVVAVLFEEGDPNLALQRLWRRPPPPGGEVHRPEIRVDARDLLPAGGAAIRYDGSLTTPPCSEGVLWTVLTSPVPIGDGQVEWYRTRFPAPSNRPLQARNGRPLTVSR